MFTSSPLSQDDRSHTGDTTGASAVSRKLRRKAKLADITVAREADLGVNDTQFTVRSHLGHILKAGDMALGYDLTTLVAPAEEAADARDSHIEFPDVMLVKKHYPKWKDRDNRYWKLRRVDAEEEDNLRRADLEKRERDYEAFLRDLEEDETMRGQVNLYKDMSRADVLAKLARGERPGRPQGMEEEEDDRPLVGLDELLDEMRLQDAGAAAAGAAAAGGDSGHSEAAKYLAAKYGLSPDAPAFAAVMAALQRNEDPAAAARAADGAEEQDGDVVPDNRLKRAEAD